jgi:hypothetical protein
MEPRTIAVVRDLNKSRARANDTAVSGIRRSLAADSYEILAAGPIFTATPITFLSQVLGCFPRFFSYDRRRKGESVQ